MEVHRPRKNSLTDTSPAAKQIATLLCPSDNPAEKVCYFPTAVSSANMAFPGYYSVTSYAGNHGTKNYYPGDPDTTDDGMFYVYAPPGSTAGVPYSRPAPAGPFRPERGVALKTVTDGTSKTLLFGEKYNQDPIFDSMSDTAQRFVNPPMVVVGIYGRLQNGRAHHSKRRNRGD